MNYNDDYPSFWGMYWKVIGAAFIGILIVFLIGWAAFGAQVMTAGIVGRGKAEITIQSAPSRIGGYDHFFNLCASIQSDESSLDAQYSQLERTDDPNDRQRIETNIAALKANRAKGINQYNADAAKDYTIGQFRDSDLPYQLTLSDYDNKGALKTTCAIP